MSVPPDARQSSWPAATAVPARLRPAPQDWPTSAVVQPQQFSGFQPQAAFGQPGVGHQPPAYGQQRMAYFEPSVVFVDESVNRRPGMVTAAAVLAFVVSGFTIPVAIPLLLQGVVTYLGLIILGIGGLYVWGGVRALTRRGPGLISVMAGLALLGSVFVLVRMQALQPGFLLGMIIPTLILCFVLNQPARAWFSRRRS